jgi:hypothetical protein
MTIDQKLLLPLQKKKAQRLGHGTMSKPKVEKSLDFSESL